MIEKVVGIDVAKASFDVAVPLQSKGKYRTKGKLANNASGFAVLGDWLDRHAPGAAVCMEATGVYHEALATCLVARGVTLRGQSGAGGCLCQERARAHQDRS